MLFHTPRQASVVLMSDNAKLLSLSRLAYSAIVSRQSTLSQHHLCSRLRGIVSLEPLTDLQIDTLAGLMKIEEHQAGDVIATAGHQASCIHVVKSGQLQSGDQIYTQGMAVFERAIITDVTVREDVVV